MPETYNGESDEGADARSVWSGTIAFGLVSLPVTMFTATRPRGIALRLLSEDGTPLQRRFFCSEDGQALERDDLVRGFDDKQGSYVEVTEDELDALAPKKSREIDLRRFVPLDQIDPMHFKRAYFVLPEEGASKAYRLLAKSMEDSGRAGIATFVMRGKEYLVAIIAKNGILRAETLRFHDELRRPSDLALPRIAEPDPDLVDSLVQNINRSSEEELDRQLLTDQWSREVHELVQAKLDKDEGVIHAEELEAEEPEGEIIDLMAILKQRLGAAEDGRKAERKEPKRASKKSPTLDLDTENASKSELYELARELNIQGRSHMSKQELLHAIQQSR